MGKKKAPALVISAMTTQDKTTFFSELSDWYSAARKLAEAKDNEAKLRCAIADKYFGSAPEGVNTVPLDFGKQLKCGIVISRSVSDKELEALEQRARAEGKISLLTQIEGLFKYKANVLVGEWKALSQDERNMYADVVTEKPGMPSLEILDIKE